MFNKHIKGIKNEPNASLNWSGTELTCLCVIIISMSGLAFTHTLCSSVISPQLRLM